MAEMIAAMLALRWEHLERHSDPILLGVDNAATFYTAKTGKSILFNNPAVMHLHFHVANTLRDSCWDVFWVELAGNPADYVSRGYLQELHQEAADAGIFDIDLCPSNVECSKLGNPCIDCSFNHSCVYGSQLNVSCTVKDRVNCSGSTTFIRAMRCQYCYQTESWEHTCTSSSLCKAVASPRQYYTAACDPFLKCKLAFCKTIADECQPFLQRFQTSKPMTPYLFEAVEKLLRYLMNRCVKPDLMKCTGPKLLSIDTKKSENLILSKNIDIGFATKRLLGETAITVTERQKLEFIHECRSMLTTMIAKLQEKSPLKQKAVRGLSSLDPCVIQHSPQLAQKRFSFLLEELNHANIINDVLAENAKKEYLHFCNLKKSELQEIFRPCDQFSDEVGLDTIYGSFLIGEANYKHLWEVIKICLVLSHGNATVEGGFSVNKSLLVENMHEKTVIAQRHIHDEIQEAGGIKNIHISKKMLDYVRGARKRYHEYLEMKKQEKSEKDKKKAEKRKLDIQVKDLEGERKKLMMATEEKREAIDVELQELKKKQASLY
uniref:Uncharacterized protein n=1 Tax=Timema monikensis TaxID=170555 RepID=A0A7R9EG29_9NEOP|nr:unnamed protein product [Timema monikensis]